MRGTLVAREAYDPVEARDRMNTAFLYRLGPSKPTRWLVCGARGTELLVGGLSMQV